MGSVDGVGVGEGGGVGFGGVGVGAGLRRSSVILLFASTSALPAASRPFLIAGTAIFPA